MAECKGFRWQPLLDGGAKRGGLVELCNLQSPNRLVSANLIPISQTGMREGGVLDIGASQSIVSICRPQLTNTCKTHTS